MGTGQTKSVEMTEEDMDGLSALLSCPLWPLMFVAKA